MGTFGKAAKGCYIGLLAVAGFVILCYVGIYLMTYDHFHARHIEIPQVQEMEAEIKTEYPRLTNIRMEYTPASDHMCIDIDGPDISDQDAINIAKIARKTLIREDFHQAFFEEMGYPKPELANRISIEIKETNKGDFRLYKFDAGYVNELYNSGRRSDEYTFNGYSQWYGVVHTWDGEKPLPEELMEQLNGGE